MTITRSRAAFLKAFHESDGPLRDRVLAGLRKRPALLAELVRDCGGSRASVRAELRALQADGYSIHQVGETWQLEQAPPRGGVKVDPYVSSPEGRYRFGFLSDTHLANVHARVDVLADLYRRFAAGHIDRVFHAGNWIDGEARFNRYELTASGFDAQLDLVVSVWPRVPNLVTYAVTGDDHEGWYAQREGVDPGRVLASKMREAGREDWRNLGYIEAVVPLRHAVTGATDRLLVAHPGGGTAYAISYSPQKYIESLEGGEKPAVALLGHWHKMEQADIRNVWVIQAGCVEDQTPWARKKRLDFHVGGGICDLEQDARTGAIVGCRVEFFRYFNAEFYVNNRWGHGRAIAQPVRTTTARR